MKRCVIRAPLVLHAALVFPGVRLRRVLHNCHVSTILKRGICYLFFYSWIHCISKNCHHLAIVTFQRQNMEAISTKSCLCVLKYLPCLHSHFLATLVRCEWKSGQKQKRKNENENRKICRGQRCSAEGKCGVVISPFVLHAALVVAAVCLRWFLGQKRTWYILYTGVFWPFPSNKLYERQKRTCFNDITYHDIKGSIKQTAGQTVDYKCQQTIQPSFWPSFKATPKTQTVMTRLALHLFAPSIGSSFDIFLSDSFTKSPLHSQVTWSSSVWTRGGIMLVK